MTRTLRALTDGIPQRPAIYLRISDDPHGDELGVARQEKHCRAIGAQRGWNMDAAEVYVDNDISATRRRGEVKERPDFNRLTGDIEASDRDGVLSYDLDRLLRDPHQAEGFYLLCERTGMHKILTVADEVDISTGHGLLVARIKAAVAAEEVRKMRQRLRDKKQQMAEQGLPAAGGMRPFGYSCFNRPDCQVPGCVHDRSMSLVDFEPAEIQKAAASVLAGGTLEAAAEAMNAAGFLTTAGNPWEGSSLRRMLVSARVAGLRSYKGEIVADAQWPAVLDRSTWEQVRALVSSRGSYTAPHRYHQLSGVLCCGWDDCTGTLSGQVTSRKGKRGPVVYACRKIRGGCGRLSIAAAPVEALVAATVGDWLRDKSLAGEITSILCGEEGTEIEDLEAQVAAEEARLGALATEREELALELVEWKALRDPVVARLAAARTALSRARRRAAATAPLGAVTVEELAAAWPAMSAASQRDVISVIARVTVMPVGKKTGVFDPTRVRVQPRWAA